MVDMEIFTKLKSYWYSKFDNSETKFLLWLVGIGLILRLLFIIETQHTPFVQNLFSDSKIYNNYALDISRNNNWLGDEAFFMAPVYPYFLAGVYKIFRESSYLIRLLQAIISSATILIIYLLARNFFNKKVAQLSAIIATFYSSFIFYSGLILSETLQIFFAAIFIYALTLDYKSESRRNLIIGIWLGILALFRANILIFGIAFLIYLLLQTRQHKNYRASLINISQFVLGILIVILPVTIRNYIVSDDFVLLTSNGGINFYIGNNEKSIGVFTTPTEFNFATDMSGEKYAEKLSHRDLSPSEASAYWVEQAFDFIKSKPDKAAYLFINKFCLFFLPEENPQSAMMDEDFYAENYSKVLQLPLIRFSLLSVPFIFGLILLISERKKHSIILLFVFSYLFASIIFFVNGRFRLALLPLAIPVSAFAIERILRFISDKNFSEIKKPIIFTSVIIVLINLVSIKPNFTDYEAYLHLGDIAYEEDRLNDAIYYYNLSLVHQDNFMTFVNLGNALAKKKEFKNAEIAFNKAIERNPNYELAYFNLAFVYTQIGNFDLAIKNYNKTIELNPNFEGAYRNLGIVYYVMEKYDLALEFFNEFLRISNDDKTKELVRKDIINIQRMIENKK